MSTAEVFEHYNSQIASLERACVTYRALASQAVEEIRAREIRITSLQAQLESLRDELRRYVAAQVKP